MCSIYKEKCLNSNYILYTLLSHIEKLHPQKKNKKHLFSVLVSHLEIGNCVHARRGVSVVAVVVGLVVKRCINLVGAESYSVWPHLRISSNWRRDMSGHGISSFSVALERILASACLTSLCACHAHTAAARILGRTRVAVCIRCCCCRSRHGSATLQSRIAICVDLHLRCRCHCLLLLLLLLLSLCRLKSAGKRHETWVSFLLSALANVFPHSRLRNRIRAWREKKECAVSQRRQVESAARRRKPPRHVTYAKCRKTPVYFLLQQQQEVHSLLLLLLLLSVFALALNKHFIDET